MHWTNPDSVRSCLCFEVFRLNFAYDFFNLLLFRFHQAEIIVVKASYARTQQQALGES